MIQTEITEKAISAHIDAVWHGYVRSRFTKRVIEVLNDPAAEMLYFTTKKSKAIKGSREESFIRELGKGHFIGKVVWHTLRTTFGD